MQIPQSMLALYCSQRTHALMTVDGNFDIFLSRSTAINHLSVFYFQICPSNSLSKKAIICIWMHKFVFSSTPFYRCPHGNQWLLLHLLVWLNSNKSLIRVYIWICWKHSLPTREIIHIWERKFVFGATPYWVFVTSWQLMVVFTFPCLAEQQSIIDLCTSWIWLSYPWSKKAITRFWAWHKFVFGATPIRILCPHDYWWLFLHFFV